MAHVAAARPLAGSLVAEHDSVSTLRRMLAGEEAAFTQVYRTLQPGLLRYLAVLVGPQDAEDVASETWAQAARDLRRFTGDLADFRAWLTAIGRHRGLDHLRARARRPVESSAEALLELAARADTESDALEVISTRAALAAIAALPPEQAEAVLLRVVVGLDATRAGTVLGRRPGAVRTAAFRGLRTLHAQAWTHEL